MNSVTSRVLSGHQNVKMTVLSVFFGTYHPQAFALFLVSQLFLQPARHSLCPAICHRRKNTDDFSHFYLFFFFLRKEACVRWRKKQWYLAPQAPIFSDFLVWYPWFFCSEILAWASTDLMAGSAAFSYPAGFFSSHEGPPTGSFGKALIGFFWIKAALTAKYQGPTLFPPLLMCFPFLPPPIIRVPPSRSRFLHELRNLVA